MYEEDNLSLYSGLISKESFLIIYFPGFHFSLLRIIHHLLKQDSSIYMPNLQAARLTKPFNGAFLAFVHKCNF